MIIREEFVGRTLQTDGQGRLVDASVVDCCSYVT